MDFTDLRLAYDFGHSTVSRLYIATTVLFAVGTLLVLWFMRGKASRPMLLQYLILFAFVTGLIFRAVSWGAATNVNGPVDTIFSSYDYARVVFYTLSELAIHLLPIVTVHLVMRSRGKSASTFGSGSLVMVSYAFAVITLVVMVALMAVAAHTPAPPVADAGKPVNDYMDGAAPFLALTDTYCMLGWWFIVAYMSLMLAHRRYLLHWSVYTYMILITLCQIGETAAIYVEPADSDYAWLIVQYVFALMVPFPSLVLATRFGAHWLPPLDTSLHEYPSPDSPIPI
ncbi:hypothetical protein DM01DRAFT_1332896 [Hesseltinella vesiculosa]|uniref:Uncharacterized protein n=1 Tax=Hesseltinella vesiculosa TaxID=101127 RepID=A0A1X2GS56_9FUNG|nr:hypothetical protein DM01DRAFT_1332896 [Hesseltinella vesiculosa]